MRYRPQDLPSNGEIRDALLVLPDSEMRGLLSDIAEFYLSRAY